MHSTLWALSAITVITGACTRSGAPRSHGNEPAMSAHAESVAASAGPLSSAAAPEATSADRSLSKVTLGGMVVCEPTSAAVSGLERAARFADANGDGKVSRAEALAVANFAVGGAFFRADENGDGTITPAEGRLVRQEFMRNNPELAALFKQLQKSGEKPFAQVATLLDIDYGKALTTADARAAARRLVDDVYARGDKNGDGAIGLDEARALAEDATRSLGTSAFNAADKDQNHALNETELRGLADGAASRAFAMLDRDHDGRLTMAEASGLLNQLGAWTSVSR